jgi:hypothetical protein
MPIVDSDQVDVTGFITAYLYFDIDTNTDNGDCSYNLCKAHEGALVSANNYTVDFGELTSTIVNKSRASTIHSDQRPGLINSIYFDISTNAASGAIVTVQSANGGLQGPGTSKIQSLGTDGSNITINSGLYGYNLPVLAERKSGVINRYSLCDALTGDEYCGATTTPKEIFNTNGLPLDTGRVRMDLAAAAAYTNNPGTYTDTLTFVATSTY